MSELQHNLFTGPQIYLTPLHTDWKKKRKEENCLGKKVYWWFLLGLIIVICKNTFLDRNAAVCCKKLALGGSQDFWLMLGLTVRQRSMAQPTNHLSTFVHCLFKVPAHICIAFTLSLTRKLQHRWMVFPTNHISITMEKNLARTFSSNIRDHLCPCSSNLLLPTVFYFYHLVCLHYTIQGLLGSPQFKYQKETSEASLDRKYHTSPCWLQLVFFPCWYKNGEEQLRFLRLCCPMSLG